MTTGSRGEYRKTAERRERIIGAATEVFSEQGYTASSVAEIAKRVGLTAPGVLHHFSGGKAELLREVLETRDLRVISHIDQQQGRAFLQGLIEIAREDMAEPGLVQLHAVLAGEASSQTHPGHGAMLGRFQNIVVTITRAFDEILAAGQLKPGIDPHRAALSTIAAIEGFGLLTTYGFDVDAENDLRDHLNRYLIDPL